MVGDTLIRPYGRWRYAAVFLAAALAVSGCKHGGGGDSSPGGATATHSIGPAPQISTAGALTLEQYDPTTSEIGGTSSNNHYTLTHEETVP